MTDLTQLDRDANKSSEYQEVAGLVCMDLDTLKEICSDQGMTADELREQINETCRMKDELIADPAVRRSRYRSTLMLLSLVEGSRQS